MPCDPTVFEEVPIFSLLDAEERAHRATKPVKTSAWTTRALVRLAIMSTAAHESFAIRLRTFDLGSCLHRTIAALLFTRLLDGWTTSPDR